MPIEIRRQSGAIDGIVAHGCDVHLERMTSGSYSLVVRDAETEMRFYLTSSRGSVRVLHDGADVPACGARKPGA